MTDNNNKIYGPRYIKKLVENAVSYMNESNGDFDGMTYMEILEESIKWGFSAQSFYLLFTDVSARLIRGEDGFKALLMTDSYEDLINNIYTENINLV